MSQSLPSTATLGGGGPEVSHDQRSQPGFRLKSSQRHGMVALGRRRLVTALLNIATYAAFLGAIAYIMSYGGWTIIDGVIFAALAVALPWTVLGFWNAVIGLSLLHGSRDPIAAVAPFAADGDVPAPITARTAVLMTLRNEDPLRAIDRLAIVKDSLDATGYGARFSFFILSDTNDPTVAALEEVAVADWKQAVGEDDGNRIVYRRRDENVGYKAGNVRDFCARWGSDYDFMLPLDADSLMSGDAIVRLVRIMQRNRRIGILQTLVVGLPTSSAFARVFQFGMRAGMRAYTMGQAWWTGDCGPFWGHNALVRVGAFHRHCKLPELRGSSPLGGHVMSHDQVEATLMRRAGYEVRVLPIEDGSWEENPPTIVDFMQRDVRWCQGNLQYMKLLGLPGLKPLSRFQLLWAVLMFIGIPAWTLIIALLPAATLEAQAITGFPVGMTIALYCAFFLMYLSPKIAGLIDVALTRDGVLRYGGSFRFAVSALVELVFSFLQGAISTIRTSAFMIGLLFGRKVSWGGQLRDVRGLPLRTAARELLPQTLFGIIVCTALYHISPMTLFWSLPLTAGYLVAIPFASFTASPTVGLILRRLGLGAIPEDVRPPREVRALQQGGYVREKLASPMGAGLHHAA
ncbi:MAG: glucans biosynthesis glucosyltransferase MdoH [Pseudomonadota bacterium]